MSAVQPPEPTYELKIAAEMENKDALSCLQLETIVYASQVSFFSFIMCVLILKRSILIRGCNSSYLLAINMYYIVFNLEADCDHPSLCYLCTTA